MAASGIGSSGSSAGGEQDLDETRVGPARGWWLSNENKDQGSALRVGFFSEGKTSGFKVGCEIMHRESSYLPCSSSSKIKYL